MHNMYLNVARASFDTEALDGRRGALAVNACSVFASSHPVTLR